MAGLLYKLAKKSKDKPSEYAGGVASGMSQGMRESGLSAALGLGLLPLMPKIRAMTQASKDVPTPFRTGTPEEIASLVSRLSEAGGRDPMQGRPLRVKVKPKPGHAEFLSPFLDPKGRKARDLVLLGKGVAPETVAHELGHATGGPWATRLRRLSTLARTPVGSSLPVALALTGALGSDTDELPTVAKAAPYVGGAQLATILAEEARANLRGQKLLERIGYKVPLKGKAKMFLPTLTYLGRAGLLVGAPMGVLKGIESYNKSLKNKRPHDPTKLVAMSPSALESVLTPKELQEKWYKRLAGT